MQIRVDANFEGVQRLLLAQQKQVDFAASQALNVLAKEAQQAAYAEMQKAFDRPAPITMRSLRIEFANRANLVATVLLKDKPLGGKNPFSMAEIIGHEFSGGSRKRTGIEFWLERAGLISSDEFVAPGAGAKLDQYGNMSRGQIVQIMSQLQLGLDPYAWKSKSERSKRNVARAGAMFWSRGGRLKRGLWMRTTRGHVVPILVIIRRPTYKRRINLDNIGKKVVDARWKQEFAKQYENAIRTAR